MLGLPCSSSTSFATTTPFALRHGPLPIRSRAFTAACPSAPVVLRYARQVFPPAFASFASAWHRASAPASPPRSPPLPGLVARKKVMPESWACAAPPIVIAARHSVLRSLRFMVTLLDRVGDAGQVTDSFVHRVLVRQDIRKCLGIYNKWSARTLLGTSSPVSA